MDCYLEILGDGTMDDKLMHNPYCEKSSLLFFKLKFLVEISKKTLVFM